jgi:hypothetical protein
VVEFQKKYAVWRWESIQTGPDHRVVIPRIGSQQLALGILNAERLKKGFPVAPEQPFFSRKGGVKHTGGSRFKLAALLTGKEMWTQMGRHRFASKQDATGQEGGIELPDGRPGCRSIFRDEPVKIVNGRLHGR